MVTSPADTKVQQVESTSPLEAQAFEALERRTQGSTQFHGVVNAQHLAL